MLKSWRFRLTLFLVSILAGIWIVPASRWAIIGYLKGEHFYQGRPTSYWYVEVQRYMIKSRPMTLWDELLDFIGIARKNVNSRDQNVKPIILQASPAGFSC